MFHEIQNPKLDSLVHCFKVPDLSMAFGDVSDDNINDVFSLFDLEEFFPDHKIMEPLFFMSVKTIQKIYLII